MRVMGGVPRRWWLRPIGWNTNPTDRHMSNLYLESMANMAETIAQFEREGIFPASMRLTVTRLRQTAPQMVPPSAKGGGVMSPQCEPHHQANIILAQGAHSPIDAAAAVTTLRALRWTATETLIAPTSVPHQGAYQAFETLEGSRLGDVLDNWISAMGEPGMRAAMASVAGHEWTMTLCLDGPYATFSQRARSEIQIATFGDRSFTGRAQRLIAMPFRVFVVAGELWQDTLERRGHIFSSQTSTPVPRQRDRRRLSSSNKPNFRASTPRSLALGDSFSN
jgi:hypothetical protein